MADVVKGSWLGNPYTCLILFLLNTTDYMSLKPAYLSIILLQTTLVTKLHIIKQCFFQCRLIVMLKRDSLVPYNMFEKFQEWSYHHCLLMYNSHQTVDISVDIPTCNTAFSLISTPTSMERHHS